MWSGDLERGVLRGSFAAPHSMSTRRRSKKRAIRCVSSPGVNRSSRSSGIPDHDDGSCWRCPSWPPPWSLQRRRRWRSRCPTHAGRDRPSRSRRAVGGSTGRARTGRMVHQPNSRPKTGGRARASRSARDCPFLKGCEYERDRRAERTAASPAGLGCSASLKGRRHAGFLLRAPGLNLSRSRCSPECHRSSSTLSPRTQARGHLQ